MTVGDLFLAGLGAHLVADWFLQNDWMARHKADLGHPAAPAHLLAHGCCLMVAWIGLGEFRNLWLILPLTVIHSLIDTRKPLEWWRKMFAQTTEGPPALHVAFWQDQAAHILCLIGGSFAAARL